MNEVLKINYETEQPTVSARDLHEQLNIKTASNTVEVRRNYLISCVMVPSAKIYTPDQLRQIFDLTWK